MFKQLARSCFIVLLLLSIIAPASANISAQQQAPSCPYQQACEITQQALGLLAKYNIPAGELDNILKTLGTSGPEGVAQYLGQLGFSQEQVGTILQEAAPLLQAGMNNSYIQAYIGELVNGKINESDLIASRQQEIIKGLRNPDNILAILNGLGIDGEEANAFLEMTQFVTELGYSPATFELTAQAHALYNLLAESGLDDEDASRLAMLALGDFATFEEEASTLGVDLDYVYENFDDAYTNFFLENGFSEDEIEAFQELAFASAVIEAGNNPEALANLLANYGYDEEFINALLDGWQGWASPDELVGFLSALGLGWDPDFADLFDLYDDDDFLNALDDWDFDDSDMDDADNDGQDEDENNNDDDSEDDEDDEDNTDE